jgi:putative tryptophan/tyrosine transport system substrate-binding protein
MRRREFIALVGSVTAVWPLAARAGKLPTIGVLGSDAPGWSAWTAVFVQRLHELGLIEGRTIAIEYRWSEGRPERVAEVAAEFVRQKVDIIVTHGGAVAALKQATSDIPIVFAIAVDPVGGGLVANLSRPGGNVTGLSLQLTDIAGKRLELLREAVPGLRRLAILFDAGYLASLKESSEAQAAARTVGLEIAPIGIRRTDEIAPAFEALKVDALYVVDNALVTANRTRIIALAVGVGLPTAFSGREFVEAGGLMSYGPDYRALFLRAADYVDKILHGTKPGDIPVEQPTRFEFVINLKTAKALGITIPGTLIARADEVVE